MDADALDRGFLGDSSPSACGSALSSSGRQDVVDIPFWKLSLVVALLAIPLAVTLVARLKLAGAVILAACRCVTQLLILGEILLLIFQTTNVWILVAYLAFMLAVASFEAVSRPSLCYNGMYVHLAIAMTVPTALTLLYLLLVIVRPPPNWHNPQYAIPLLGMLLGNALNGVTVGMKSLLEAISAERHAIEWALALGATKFEALKPTLQQVMLTALTPLINMLSTAGLIAIPGMMTGQILAGSNALTAAKYQVMVLFAVGAAGTCGCLIAMLCAANAMVDEHHRLQLDRLKAHQRPFSLAKVGAWLQTCWARVIARRPSESAGDAAALLAMDDV